MDLLTFILLIAVVPMLGMAGLQLVLLPKQWPAMRKSGFPPATIIVGVVLSSIAWPVSGASLARQWWKSRA